MNMMCLTEINLYLICLVYRKIGAKYVFSSLVDLLHPYIYVLTSVNASKLQSFCPPDAVFRFSHMSMMFLFLLTDESGQCLPRRGWVHTNPQARLADCYFLSIKRQVNSTELQFLDA